jgi:hypothetical protein
MIANNPPIILIIPRKTDAIALNIEIRTPINETNKPPKVESMMSETDPFAEQLVRIVSTAKSITIINNFDTKLLFNFIKSPQYI